MSARSKHYSELERLCKEALDVIERASCDFSFTEEDLEKWDDVHDALINRPQISDLE